MSRRLFWVSSDWLFIGLQVAGVFNRSLLLEGCYDLARR
jgi:hypothetical protein